jgi:flagellar hook protein FlgE
LLDTVSRIETMTISSSLNAGVMGLNVNATRLATISNNIANSGTNGYKRADVDFSSLVVNQSTGGYSAGGVRGTAVRAVSDAGALVTSGRSTDIAIDGNGMLPVTSFTGLSQPAAERDFMMVPTGSFQTDAEGYLRTESGLFLMGWNVDAEGQPITTGRGSPTGLVPINLNEGRFSAEETTTVQLGVNLPGDPTVLPASNTLDTPVEYFDQIGLPQTFDTTFVRNAGGDWDITITDNSSGAPVQAAAFNVTFNADGSLGPVTPGAGAAYSPATGDISLTLPSGPIAMFIGRPGTTQGLSSIGTPFQTQNISTNGSAAGELQSVQFGANGELEAIYNTGARRTLFSVPVATVANPNGMQAVGSQAYTATRESGGIYLWDSGTGSAGNLTGFTLMESNTDVAAELTSLIETQRAYSSNAKIVQTVDEMLQETTNLKR